MDGELQETRSIIAESDDRVALAGHSSKKVYFAWVQVTGEHTLTVTVDVNDDVVEALETNNAKERIVTIVEDQGPVSQTLGQGAPGGIPLALPLVIIAILVLLVVFMWRRRSRKKALF